MRSRTLPPTLAWTWPYGCGPRPATIVRRQDRVGVSNALAKTFAA